MASAMCLEGRMITLALQLQDRWPSFSIDEQI
jgi:hypothetical protein